MERVCPLVQLLEADRGKAFVDFGAWVYTKCNVPRFLHFFETWTARCANSLQVKFAFAMIFSRRRYFLVVWLSFF